jgi:kinetochore protein Spc7/SPC105
MDFLVPLGQSLRPAEKDEAWLALKKVTHSGNDPSEPEPSSEDMPHEHGDEDMNLDDAMARLKRARDSMSLSQTQEAHDDHDDSFTSTENSFEDEFDANKTLNLSRVLGRPSVGTSRMSMGYQDSNMDESEVYGNIVAARQSLAPQPRPSEPLQAPKSSVFQPPAPQNNNLDAEQFTSQSAKPPATTSSTAFAFTLRAPSPTKTSNTPSKTKPKPTFSAAFAPPVARPSPKKPESSSASRPSLAKRPRPSNQDEIDMDVDKPSPAKRQALAGKWLGAAEPANEESPTPAPATKTVPKPKPLSPSKKAPFQSSGTASAESTSRPPSALRRPSGYFAKRKSLAVGFSAPPTNEPTPSVTVSPKKKSGIGMGRASMGSGASDAWARFNKAAGSGVSEKALGKQKSSGKEAEAEACVRESARQSSASPSPTRGSPAPAQRGATQQTFQQDERSPSPEVPSLAESNDDVLDVQDNGDHSGKMEIDVDATRQWREGVEPAKYDEEDDTVSLS